MATGNKNDRKENIQQQPSKDKGHKKTDTPIPPQRKDPQAKPDSDDKDNKR